MSDKYEVIFEFKIRLIRPKPERGSEVDWALMSLGIDELGREIYKVLLRNEALTLSEILSIISEQEDKVVDALDTLYSLGLIEKLGEAYFVSKDLPICIKTRTKRVIERVLNEIARVLEVEGSYVT